MYNLALMRTLLILLLCYWAISVKCQVPASLVQERSVIILDFPLQEEDGFLRRGNWKEQAAKIQSSLEVMGVDGIGYLHRDDFAANEEIKQSFLEFFKTRGIKNVLTFSKNERNLFTIEIEDFENNMAQWSAEGGSLDQVLFRMGKAIKQPDQRAGIKVDGH